MAKKLWLSFDCEATALRILAERINDRSILLNYSSLSAFRADLNRYAKSYDAIVAVSDRSPPSSSLTMANRSSSLFSTSESYLILLEGLKQRIRTSQLRAALAVNQEMIMLYWSIGQEILQRQETEGWGSKVIDRLSADLKREFPEIKGFGARSLKYMRAFAEAYPEEAFVHQFGAQIPWRHNCIILEKIKNTEGRRRNIQKTIEHGWSRNVLVLQIEAEIYEQRDDAINNFAQTLPSPQSDLAQQLIKDPYSFDFLSLGKDAQERELEAALVTHIRDFLLELGMGFAFMGSQYPLTVDGRDYAIDMLFYHTQLRCYVVIELHMGEFEPAFAGTINFYVAAIDDTLRRGDDQPTIGLILCKSKSKTTAEYALRNLNTPIAVSTHSLPKALQEQLPSVKELEEQLETVTQDITVEGIAEA